MKAVETLYDEVLAGIEQTSPESEKDFWWTGQMEPTYLTVQVQRLAQDMLTVRVYNTWHEKAEYISGNIQQIKTRLMPSLISMAGRQEVK